MGDCSGTRRRKKKENNSFGWVYLRFAQHGRAPRVSAADSFLLPVRVPKAPRYTLTILAREKNKDRDRGIKQTVCGWDGTGWDGTGKRDDVWRNIQRHVVSRYLRYCAPTPFNFNKNGGRTFEIPSDEYLAIGNKPYRRSILSRVFFEMEK